MNEAYLLIGGNIGKREDYLAAARTYIGQDCGILLHQSALYETAAWGLKDQAAFLNQALAISTSLNPEELLKKVLAIEEKLGRKRVVKFGPRIIDIDILLFAERVVRTKGLTIPHPEMQNRRFVLEPLAEIAPDQKHPVLQKTIRQLLEDCADKLTVQKFQ